jgi:Na+-transporting methylmalonyl-CoA/oxaloacetate decarboxylase gamma subunit
MGNVLAILLGLICIAGGGWLIKVWGAQVIAFLEGFVGIFLILLGLLIAAIGITELRSAAEERRLREELKAEELKAQAEEKKEEEKKE